MRKTVRTLHPLYLLAGTCMAQGAGFGALFIIFQQFSSLPFALLLQALVAFGIAALFELSFSWRIVNSLAGGAAFLYMYFALPPILLSIPLTILLLIYAPTFWTRVPFYPTSPEMLDAIAAQLPSKESFSFVDLGSGFGSCLFQLAKRFPQASFTGVEVSPLPTLIAAARASITGTSNVRFIRKSFWQVDLSQFDVVYAFLSPEPMPRIWEKARKEMRPGTLLLVNSFPAPYAEDSMIETEDSKCSILYVYRLR